MQASSMLILIKTWLATAVFVVMRTHQMKIKNEFHNYDNTKQKMNSKLNFNNLTQISRPATSGIFYCLLNSSNAETAYSSGHYP